MAAGASSRLTVLRAATGFLSTIDGAGGSAVVEQQPCVADVAEPLPGSLSRQRRQEPASCGGVVRGKTSQSGSRFSTEASDSETVSPPNGRRPVSISYSTTPKAQMSARLSTALPRACSGAM